MEAKNLNIEINFDGKVLDIAELKNKLMENK